MKSNRFPLRMKTDSLVTSRGGHEKKKGQTWLFLCVTSIVFGGLFVYILMFVSKEDRSGSKYVLMTKELKGDIGKAKPINLVRRPKELSILAVGGTDGSGTRRVVQILTQLGVKMVAEDGVQYDINAASVGGWPQVVVPVLQNTHSVNYNPNDLPKELREKTRASIQTIINDVRNYSTRSMISTRSYKRGGLVASKRGVQASGISYGFKAPVVMSLCPWFAEEIPHFRFLHVVRDGRDIAFSGNQSPVEKFFNVSFENFLEIYDLPLSVKAIKLWSSWNADAHAWAQKMLHNQKTGGNRSFDYLVINTEELVHESPAVRYKSIKRIAEWVGSDASSKDICCEAIAATKFLGTHDAKTTSSIARNPRVSAKKKLEAQYGKWKTKLNGNKNVQLKNMLMKEGHEGLEKFGYLSDKKMQGDPNYRSICDGALNPANCPLPGVLKFIPKTKSNRVKK